VGVGKECSPLAGGIYAGAHPLPPPVLKKVKRVRFLVQEGEKVR